MIPHAITTPPALLLSGDFGYLELLRSQLHVLLDNANPRRPREAMGDAGP